MTVKQIAYIFGYRLPCFDVNAWAKQVCSHHKYFLYTYFFLNKNKLNKNNEVQIAWKIRTNLEQSEAEIRNNNVKKKLLITMMKHKEQSHSTNVTSSVLYTNNSSCIILSPSLCMC